MKAAKILFATDFSPTSETALAVATSLARANRAELLIAHVNALPPNHAGEGVLVELEIYEASLAYQQLEKITLADARIPVRRIVLRGSAAEEIVSLAEDERVDLIVIGTHGRTGLKRLLLGSVAEAVVRHASCPVLTVKPGQVVGAAMELTALA